MAGEFWGKVHYRTNKRRTLCGHSTSMSLRTTNRKKQVTCKTCKSLLRYQAKVKRTGRF